MSFKKTAAPLVAAATLAGFGGTALAAQPRVPQNAFTTKLATACKAIPTFPTSADKAKTVAALKKTAPALERELVALKAFYNTQLPQPPASILNTAEALNTDVGKFIDIFQEEIVAVKAGNLGELRRLRKQVDALEPRLEKEFRVVGVPGCL